MSRSLSCFSDRNTGLPVWQSVPVSYTHLDVYKRQHSVQCNTNYKSDHQAYLLLPVWMLISNFKGKKYLFAMNGQTGKIVGELPCDTGRSVKWFLLIDVYKRQQSSLSD